LKRTLRWLLVCLVWSIFRQVSIRCQTLLRHHDVLEEIVAPDLLERTRRATDMLLTAFLNYRITIEEQVAESDRVATVWTASGTHQGQACETEDRVHLLGMPRLVPLYSDQLYSLLVGTGLAAASGHEPPEPEGCVCGLGI